MSVIVYTKDLCGYCDAAKNLLRTMNVRFDEAKVGTDLFSFNTRSPRREGFPA